jgi:hypothetical protein
LWARVVVVVASVVVVVGSVVVVVASVVVVVGSVVVVVASVVVVVSCAVVGATVVAGAVTIGWVVVALNVLRASVVVVRSTAGGVLLGAGWASRAVAGLVGDGVGEVLGWRERVVVVDAEVGADSAGTVEGVPPGGRVGVGGAESWGTRAAEATRAARTEAVRPKAKSVRRQGCRGGFRCRGGRSGMTAVVPVPLVLPSLGAAHRARAVPSHMGRGPCKTDRTARSCPSMRAGM